MKLFKTFVVGCIVVGIALLCVMTTDILSHYYWTSSFLSTERLVKDMISTSESGSPDIAVIKNAARRLRERKARAASSALAAVIENECCEVILALGTLGDGSSIPALLRTALPNPNRRFIDSEYRRNAVESAIQEMGKPALTPLWGALWTEEDPSFVIRLLTALGTTSGFGDQLVDGLAEQVRAHRGSRGRTDMEVAYRALLVLNGIPTSRAQEFMLRTLPGDIELARVGFYFVREHNPSLAAKVLDKTTCADGGLARMSYGHGPEISFAAMRWARRCGYQFRPG